MIAALAIGQARRGTRRAHAHRAMPPQARQRASRRTSAHVPAASRAAASPSSITWETRSFAAAAGAILVGFVLAVAYLGQITGLSASDYELQRLAAQRDELRRQHALADVQLARLDAPARIEAHAQRLGLVRIAHVPVMNASELLAKR